MARAPEPDVNVTEALAPQGNVYDTYVRPAEPQASPLHEVANALAPLSSDLSQFAAEETAQLRKQEVAKGEAAFYNKHQAGYTEAVATDAIPAQHSPWFMQGYGRMAGLNDASNIGQTIGPDYQALDKNQDDPQAFDKWFFPYVQSKVNPAQANNPAYLKSWAVGIQALHSQYSAEYVKDRSAAVKVGATQNFTGNLGNTIDDQYLSAGGAPDYGKMADSIQTIRDAATKMGLDKKVVDQAVVDVVALKALKYKNPAILDVLDHKPAAPDAAQPGPVDAQGISLGDTEYGAHQKLTTAQAIEARIHQDRERQFQDQQRQDKQGYDTAITTVMQGFSKDINYQVPPDLMQAIQKHDPTFPAKIAELRKNILVNNTVEDPAVKAKLYEDIAQTNGGLPMVIRAFGRGDLKTQDSIKSATEYATLVENYNRQGGAFKILEDPSFKSLEQAVITHTKDPKLFGSMFAELGMTDAGRSAMNYARQTAMQWQIAHPNASPTERQQFLFDLQEQTVKAIGNPMKDQLGDAAAQTRPTFTPPTRAPAPATSAPPAAAPAQPAQPAAPAGTPTPGNPEIPATIQKFGTMPTPPTFAELPNLGVSPAVIKAITDMAAQAGVPPQTVIQKMWEGGRAGGPQPAAPPGKQGALEGGPTTVNLPGGGRVELHGVHPDVAASLSDWAGRLGGILNPVGTANAGEAAPQATTAGKSPLELAQSFVGLNETDHAATLQAFFTKAGAGLDPRTTPWCARFVNTVLEASGAHGSGSDSARSLLQVGDRVERANAEPGDIIVFPRGSGGHVGFIKSIDPVKGTVDVLAGNQGGASQKGGGVTVETFPLGHALGIRRITKKVAEAEAGANTTATA